MTTNLEHSLDIMQHAFRRLESHLPPPKTFRRGSQFVLRYEEKGVEQAILQKLARAISGLAASQLLLASGFVQEQAALHRIVDELGEDVVFLAIALTNDTVTDLHTRYLDAFYAEEYEDPNDIVGSHKSRDIVPRKKIRAYLSRMLGDDASLASGVKSGDVLHKMYSGFVHGASPQIMEMCSGNPPKFHLFGMTGTPKIAEHFGDSWNYHYRTLTSLTVAAKAFGDAELVGKLYEYIRQFEEDTGRSGGIDSEVAT